MKNKTKKFQGIGLYLTVIFIILKLTKITTWSWILVLSPLLVPISLIILIVVAHVVKSAIIALKNEE